MHAKSTFSLSSATFSCSNIIEGVDNLTSKLVKLSPVKPCVYKCTNAILVNSDSNIFCILSTVLANLISSAAKVALP